MKDQLNTIFAQASKSHSALEMNEAIGGLGLGLGTIIQNEKWAGMKVTELIPGSPAAGLHSNSLVLVRCVGKFAYSLFCCVCPALITWCFLDRVRSNHY